MCLASECSDFQLQKMCFENTWFHNEDGFDYECGLKKSCSGTESKQQFGVRFLLKKENEQLIET